MSRYPVLRTEVAARVVMDRLAAVTPGDSMLHRLNETATFLWQKMEDGDRSIEELAGELFEEYETTKEQALEDVEELVEELERKGLVTVEDRPGGSSLQAQGR